jgi:hypothetical protein
MNRFSVVNSFVAEAEDKVATRDEMSYVRGWTRAHWWKRPGGIAPNAVTYATPPIGPQQNLLLTNTVQ